jgi:hypothetical protein
LSPAGFEFSGAPLEGISAPVEEGIGVEDQEFSFHVAIVSP